MPPTANINNVMEESGHVQAMKRGWKNTHEMMVHITTTATPPPTIFNFNLFNFVVNTWQPTILEMTLYEKNCHLKAQ